MKQTAATAQVDVNWREEGSTAAAAIKTAMTNGGNSKSKQSDDLDCVRREN